MANKSPAKLRIQRLLKKYRDGHVTADQTLTQSLVSTKFIWYWGSFGGQFCFGNNVPDGETHAECQQC